MIDTPRSPSSFVRWFNRRASSVPLDGARMAAEAGVSDARAVEGATRLCQSISESHPTPFGLRYARQLVSTSLKVRARVDAFFVEHPEVEATPLQAPLIIYGLQRSGTTFLHRVASAAPDAKPLLMWEMMKPVPPARGPDLRKAGTTAAFWAYRWAAGSARDTIHYIRPGLPDECQFLTRLDLRAPMFWTGFAALAYADWLIDDDMEPTCRLYRRLLQIFRAQNPGARLVLKNPGHALYAKSLLEVIPEACPVHIHRDPCKTLPSLCNLTFASQIGLVARVDREAVVKMVTRVQHCMAQRSLALDATPLGERVLHLRYRDFIADPPGTIAGVHAHFDLPRGPDLDRALRAEVSANRQAKGYKPGYTLEGMGLSKAKIEEEFRDYSARFLA